MHKLSLCFLLSFFMSYPCYAATSYGTRMPGKRQFSYGVQNYTVFKSYLQDNNGTMRSVQNFVLISYGILDWLSLDLRGGIGHIKQHPAGQSEIDYSAFLGGGYGFRITINEQEKSKMVFGFQHISVHPHTTHVQGDKNKAVLDDWQFSLLASYKLSIFTPYIGTRWSRMDYIHWVNGERNRKKSDLTKDIGLIFGVDIPISKKIWLNLEGQLFDTQAVATSFNLSF